MKVGGGGDFGRDNFDGNFVLKEGGKIGRQAPAPPPPLPRKYQPANVAYLSPPPPLPFACQKRANAPCACAPARARPGRAGGDDGEGRRVVDGQANDCGGCSCEQWDQRSTPTHEMALFFPHSRARHKRRRSGKQVKGQASCVHFMAVPGVLLLWLSCVSTPVIPTGALQVVPAGQTLWPQHCLLSRPGHQREETQVLRSGPLPPLDLIDRWSSPNCPINSSGGQGFCWL